MHGDGNASVLKPAEPRIHRKGMCVVCDRNELDQNPFALSHTAGKGASTAEPAPSAGWEEELENVLYNEANQHNFPVLHDSLKSLFRTAVREAEDRAYLKALGEYRNLLAFSHRGDLLYGFDEAVTIAGYGTREVQAKLHDKRRELEKN
jgi:hypothetical protein